MIASLSQIPDLIDSLPITERERLELHIDSYNDLQGMRWFGARYMNKEELLEKYDNRHKDSRH